MAFYQNPPEIYNFYINHDLLRSYLEVSLDPQIFAAIDDELSRLGQRVVDEIEALGREAQDNEPVLTNYTPWGKRVDELEVSRAWDDLKDIAAEEGLIATGYAREQGASSRIYQMAKLMLYTPSSAIYTCPLAMADGAARLIETLAPELLQEPYQHLISNNPDQFWVAGQWMTEREGGSDVGNSSTIARQLEGNTYELSGDKWFTSAATAEMAMTLARIEENGEVIPGSRGLSLFYLRIRDDDGKLNGIQINKLKDKLGTRALPTAELTLDGCKATLIGEPGRGVKYITTILNITRIYNAMSSVAYMGRGLQLARDYATKREAFGKTLAQLPLHQEVLASLEIEYTTSFLLVFYVVELQGKRETDQATAEEEAILRLLTPVAKLFTGKRAMSMMSEVVESIGGMGYIEETGIPALLRDTQVFSIWEGTTNVLSLDTLRAMHKEQVLPPFIQHVGHFLQQTGSDSGPRLEIAPLQEALAQLQSTAEQFEQQPRELTELVAREFSYGIARVTIAYLLLRFHASLTQQEKSEYADKIAIIYRHWVRDELSQLDSLEHFDASLLQDIQDLLD